MLALIAKPATKMSEMTWTIGVPMEGGTASGTIDAKGGSTGSLWSERVEQDESEGLLADASNETRDLAYEAKERS